MSAFFHAAAAVVLTLNRTPSIGFDFFARSVAVCEIKLIGNGYDGLNHPLALTCGKHITNTQRAAVGIESRKCKTLTPLGSTHTDRQPSVHKYDGIFWQLSRHFRGPPLCPPPFCLASDAEESLSIS